MSAKSYTPSILTLTSTSAREFFLDAENYCNVDLPKYVDFQPLLNEIDILLTGVNLKDYHSSVGPGDNEKVNYRLLGNKDGSYGWRPYELIHPALYIDLVHLITEQNNWNEIVERLKGFERDSFIVCRSLPCVKNKRKKQKATQILSWWEGIEQDSLKMALSYSFIYDADISNCYGSIYTHSIAWSLHGKEEARKDRSGKHLLGSKIDDRLQSMRFRQTNGIPQGNAVSDLIAELVLGYADKLITDKLVARKINKRDFKLIRYRDDYRIFTNKPEVGKIILKEISETLSQLGMHLNTSKTRESSDVILGSVKEDKIDELFVTPKEQNYAKWLLQIYATIQKHPNSGKVVRQISNFYDNLHSRLENNKKLESYEDAEVMLSIVTNIAIRNPKYYNWTVAVISILLDTMSKTKRKTMSSKILKKFDSIPNTGLLDIWLQRATFATDPAKEYGEPFCKLVTVGKYPGNNLIWSSEWIDNSSLRSKINKIRIIDYDKLKSIQSVIGRDETDTFKNQPT